MATVVAVCVSDVRGVQKTPVAEIELIAEHGAKGDAHAGAWHRQVSLLADESAERMRRKGLTIDPGAFGENILTRGIDLVHIPIGRTIRIGGPAPASTDVVLEVTQIGKVCHDPCAIYAQAGECIMPTEGIFCRVAVGGVIRAGDAIEVLPGESSSPAEAGSQHASSSAGVREFRTAVLVLSDSRSSGERGDQVIPTCAESLQGTPFSIVCADIISDDREQITRELRALVDRGDIDLILTSGGTGLAPRDNTPEATREVIEREASGLAELMRLRGLEHTPRAMLTRGIAGAAGRTLIINLPGSPKAVREGIAALLPILPHAMETLLGSSHECARE